MVPPRQTLLRPLSRAVDLLISPRLRVVERKHEMQRLKLRGDHDKRVKDLERSWGKHVRDLQRKQNRGFTYDADGLATMHLSPFLEDDLFSRLYDEMAAEWFVNQWVDARWRVWLLTRFARRSELLPGAFAEFGVYRAGYAFMILGLTENAERWRPFHLFDTFAGIPRDRLTEGESEKGFGGRLGDTSVEYVEQRLARWQTSIRIHAGDVFTTLPRVETGDLAFAHIDLNASEPTLFALEYAYRRLVPGGALVFDDYGYGWQDYADQRDAIDRFFSDLPEEPIALPTGQAVVLKVSSG
jgi:O-methyltransferase